MFIIWYKKINIKVNHIKLQAYTFHTGVYIYQVTTAGVFKYDRMWRMIDKLMCFHIYEKPGDVKEKGDGISK